MSIARYIDHTLLKPDATSAQIAVLCEEAADAGFAAVCIPPYHVAEASEILKETEVAVATVIGFPLGYNSIGSKLMDTRDAIAAGADEIDMVYNQAAFKNGDWRHLEKEIRQSLELIHDNGCILKLIIETGNLSEPELLKLCRFYSAYEIDFLKTSSGYAEVGATVKAVRTMRHNLPASTKIKASGGIRTFEFAKELIEAGAARIGSSSGLSIIEDESYLSQF